MGTVTIQHLDVRFRVEGNDDEEFTRLFQQHIRAWARAVEAEQARQCRSRAERGIGDREANR